MLKKVCILGAICGMFMMASCQSQSNSKNNTQTGADLDSMVDQATSAVKGSADSVKQSINTAIDSTKAKIDSKIKGH